MVIAPHPCQTCKATPGRYGALVCPHCYGSTLGPQGAYLASTADYLLFGGQMGGGKTYTSVLKAARYLGVEGFSALLLRKTRRELNRQGSLWPVARSIFPRICPGVEFNKTELTATSPQGAVVEFGFLEGPDDHERYMSAQYDLIIFDEATRFRAEHIRFLFSRLRGSDPSLPRQLCLSTNPGGQGHEAIFRDFEPWLNPAFNGYGGPAKPWEKRHFVPGHGEDGEPAPTWCAPGTPDAQTANFIPARLSDNPSIAENDPGYAQRVKLLDLVTYERLAKGNWLIKEAAGTVFRRDWFKQLQAMAGRLPEELTRTRIRAWDFAATEGEGDWTVGARWSLARAGYKALEQVERHRFAPGKVLDLFWRMAASDPKGTTQIIPQDPGAAGKIVADTILKEAKRRGVRVRSHILAGRGNKLERSKPASAQAWRGEIRVMPGPWLEEWLDEHTRFPDQCDYDDQVDTTSDAALFLDDFAANGRFTLGRDA